MQRSGQKKHHVPPCRANDRFDATALFIFTGHHLSGRPRFRKGIGNIRVKSGLPWRRREGLGKPSRPGREANGPKMISRMRPPCAVPLFAAGLRPHLYLALLVGKGLAPLPQFEPVCSASGLSTPHPCGNPVFRNAFLTRLRRGDCARRLSGTDSEYVCQCDPSAPLLLRYRS